MALQGSGQISFANIQTEFGGTNPIEISEYLRNGGLVPDAAANANIPTTLSNMRMSGFYGAVNVIAYTASNTTNLDAGTAFGSNWAANVPKELIIPSGVVVGSTSTASPALILPTGMGGSLVIKNSGSIHGAGGAANSGVGGDAILAQSSVTIQNNGVIYAGGGGGGKGGNGTAYGSSYQFCNIGSNENSCPACSGCNSGYVVTSCPCTEGGGTCLGRFTGNAFRLITCTQIITTIGGDGGVGQGYNQAAGTGAAGGTNAGTGGNGGAFGASGSAGSNGTATAGAAGGLSGYYVNGISNVTFSVTGTVAGRTV